MADGIPGGGRSTITSSAGKSFINTVMARLPFSYAMIDNITQLNPKYEVFQDLATDRASRVNQQSIFRANPEDEMGIGSVLVDKNFQRFMYANIDLDKVKRLQDYRRMSTYAELSDCLDEICDELLFEDTEGEYLNLKVTGEFSKIIEDEINKEFKKFIDVFELKKKGWSYFRQFLIDGELFWENVISETHPEFGILGVVSVPTELINPFYNNVQNDLLEGFALRKPVVNKRTERSDKEELIIFEKNQVTYIHSGRWNEDSTMKLPYIENARRAYKQLSLVEDSIIIYRMVRAPERLVFNVDTGNMSAPKSEGYMRRLMQQYWSKKTYDTSTGRVTNVYDPQSYLDSYWFPKRAGTEGTKVDHLTSSVSLGQLDDLTYFLKKLYRSMKVPTGRLNADDAFKDGNDMTREEVRFGKFLKRVQLQFAEGLKNSFITHLKLRNMWENYKIKERYLEIQFNLSSSFLVMRQQQLFDVKYNNFNNLSQNESISHSFAQKKYLTLTDEEMAANREWRRKDAAFAWELDQILSSGPNWKEQYQATQAAAAEMESGGGASSGGGGGGASTPETPPEFGPSPTGAPAGAEGAPATGQPPAGAQGAPAGGAAPAATPPPAK